MKTIKTATIKSIQYSIMNGFEVVLDHFDNENIQFIKPGNLRFGGKNCEIGRLCVGGKIAFEYNTVSSVRDLGIVTLISDGIQEVNEEGDLIRW